MSSGTSVVVCAYTIDRWEGLSAAVRSLLEQQPPIGEIIVVIDHNDELAERAARHLPGCRVIESSHEPGLSGARNTGLAVSNGALVAFLDDDAIALPGWHAALVAAFSDRSVIGAGGTALPLWQVPPPEWLPPAFLWVVGCTYEGHPETAVAVRNVLGCNMAFRRSSLIDIGGFRSELGRKGALPFGAEETEICIRLVRHAPGTVILYVPDAVVRHSVPRSRTSWGYFRRRCFAEGLSKAVLSGLVGSGAALRTERRYVRSVLPRAIARAVSDAVRLRKADQILRAAAILGGLTFTAAGYAWGTMLGTTSVGSRIHEP